MIRQSKASALWKGGLKDGSGTFSVPSGVLSEVPYTFSQRFEQAPGTNPEELVGAALASCFSMALASDLGKAGMSSESVDTKATVNFELKDGKATVTRIHLDCTAKVPGASLDAVKKVADGTRTGCPVARLLDTEITVDLKLA